MQHKCMYYMMYNRSASTIASDPHSDIQTLLLPTVKMNVRDVLSMCQDKFSHVSQIRFFMITLDLISMNIV